MTDALELIAEAQKRQKEAEHSRDIWKERAEHYRDRCRHIIEMTKGAQVTPPPLTEDGQAYCDRTHKIVQELANVMADPYARYPDDDYLNMTHDRAVEMAAWRLQDVIAAAIKADREARK